MIKIKSVMIVAINIMLLALLIPLPQITSQNVSQPTESPALISSFPNLDYQRRYIDPELYTSTGRIRVLIVASNALSIKEVARYMVTSRATPSFGSFYVITGSMDAERVQQLASNPLIFSILKDRKVEYPISTDLPDISSLKASLKKNLAFRLAFEGDAFSGKPETTLRDVVNITGAKKTWEDLGINGTGVTIAILDTGVDYGSMGLGYWDAVARDQMGYPAAFDPDAECMVLTNLTISKVFTFKGSIFLNTTGVDPWVYFLGWVLKLSDIIDSPWPFPMDITGIRSASGNYHFGVMFQLSIWDVGLYWVHLFPVLVADSVKAGVYDTVYVDLSFDAAWLNLNYGLPFGTWPPEFSFADETPVTPTGWTVAARDFDGDGYYDLSAGSLAYFLDVWGVSPNKADRGLILKPLDPAGNYTVFENDWFGHGTSCAESAAGRDKGHPLAGPGIAPGAKILGMPGLWIGDIIEGEFWAAGFDLIPGTEGWSPFLPGYGWVYGTWNYTGNHKADIISNSWGISDWPSWLYGLPWYDLLTILEDALTVPGYLHPDYPGTVIVHAWGNGAPGYGTVTDPSYGTLPITVGASTSLNLSQYIFSLGGGYQNDVISWSARGPTPLGNVKPDVVNVGAWAWVSGPVWMGAGNGSNAYDVFGGTSMAAPLTAGSAALTIQAYNKARGTKPTPETVKVILKSTAKDLGYDAFVQGAGRVDAFAATSLALKKQGVTIASPITWENVRSRIQHAWSLASAFLGYPLQGGLPSGPINDVSWFAGTLRPGSSASADFTITNPTNSPVTATVKSVVHEQVGTTTTYSGKTALINNWADWGNLTVLNIASIPSDAELMVVTLNVPYSYFDPNWDYTWDRRFRIWVLDWIDVNGNSLIERNETYNINYGYSAGTGCEARVGFPLTKFKGKPVIWVSQANQPWMPYPDSVSFKVYTSYYRRESWAWVTTPSIISVNASSSSTFKATLTVPSGTPQGVYEGQLIVNVTGSYRQVITIPVVLTVPAALSTTDLTMDIVPPTASKLYDSYRVNGYFDWRWRYEAGDWKTWAFDIQDPTVVAAFVSCKWTGKMTDIDMVGINPGGFITDAALSPYLGSGVFKWWTRTGAHEEYVVLDTNMVFDSMLGVYTVLLHNVLFDGTTFPESVTGKVELVKLAPRGPINIVTKAGKTVSQGFTITTGKALKNVGFFTYYPWSPFLVKFNPNVVSNITAMGSAEITVNVDVPAGTQKGTYMVILVLYADEISPYFPVYVLLNITVNDTPPTVNVVSPISGKILGGTIPIEVYASDPSGIDKVEFMVGALEKLYRLTFDSTTGTWKGNLNTTALLDGATTVNVTATDKAGNVGRTSVTFTVDNTLPSVLITVPVAGAELSGMVTIQFTATDTNLETVYLYIDNASHTVTGQTTYSWNSTHVGDGSHIIRITAVDRAGNLGSKSVTVTTNNVALARQQSYQQGQTIGYNTGYDAGQTTGIAIGSVIGLVIGAVVAFALSRRRS